MRENLEFLLKKIFTREDCISILEDLNLLQQIVFKSQASLSKKAENLTNKNLYHFFLKLEKEGEIFLEPKNQFEFLERLKDFIKNLPLLKLEVAFLPSQKTIEKISEWIKKEVGKKVILDIYFNPTIVGGAILEYGGKYFDFSLGKEIDKIFPTNL